MEEIEKRLRESTDTFIKSFENWVSKSKNLESREALMEAMHEVRKVVSRVEIEIAISERDRLGSRPLPIPSHRSQRRSGSNESAGEMDEADFNSGDENEGQQEASAASNARRERRPRRPMNRGQNNNGNQANGNNNGESQA
jgi:hypothetical protein